MSLTLREVIEAMGGNPAVPSALIPVEIGQAYLFRTIGYHWLGRVQAVNGRWLTLTDASWVSDTGRYSEAVSGNIGTIASSELEPSPRPVILNSDHITDAVHYPFELPRNVK